MATRTLSVVINGNARGAQDAFGDVAMGADSIATKLESVGRTMARVGTAMTATITLPLVFLGKAAFDAAGSLGESLSKSNAIFEDNSRAIRRWAEGASTDFGQSTQQALESAATFGNVFRQMGLGVEPATLMSKKLTELASDFASFHNADIVEVIAAQTAAFRGEYDALQRFVPTITAAAVETRALADSGKENADQLTAQEKAAATYALMLEGAGKALGDFDKTSGSAVNKQRILQAKFQDVAAKLGDALIPIFERVAEVVEKVADWFSRLDPKWQNLAVYAGIAAAAIGPLIGILGGAITILTAVSLPVLAIGAAIAGLAAAAVLLYAKWDEVWSWMRDHPAIAALILMITGPVTLPIIALVGTVKFLQEHWDTIWPAIQGTLEAVWSVVEPILHGIDNVIRATADAVVWLAAVAKPYFDDFVRGAQVLWDAVNGPLGAVLDALKAIATAADKVGDVLGVGRGTIADLVPQEATGGVGGGSRQFRAAGGPVSALRPYIVGEEGPEMFVPALSGTIIPNHHLAVRPPAPQAGGHTTYNINVAGSVVTERELDEVVAEAMTRWNRFNGK